MTIKECIDVVDNLKPNQYSIEDKVAWLTFLDMTIINEVLKTHEGYDGRYDTFTGYSPDILTAGLIVPSPYDRVYTSYLKMKIDEENGETARYNNSVTLYNTYLMEYKKWYNANHMPLSPSDRRTMPQSKPSTLDVSEVQLEQLRKVLYANLHDDMLAELSDENIYAIVKKYMDTNAQMLKGKDGQDGVDGRDGLDGMDGKDGVNGVGIKKVWIDDAGELNITLTSGTTHNLGVVKGRDGVDGKDGKDGEKGEQGIQGEKGEAGKDGEVTLDYANSHYADTITTSASGSVVLAEDSANKPLVGLTLYGKDKQNKYEGYQLIPSLVLGSTKTISGVTMVVKEDRCIVNGTPTNAYDVLYSGSLTLEKGEYYVSGGDVGSGDMFAQVTIVKNGVKSYYRNTRFTIDGTEESVTYQIQNVDTTAFSNYAFYPMISKSVALPFEPYVGSKPSPSADYKQPIEVCGAGGTIEGGVFGGSLIPPTTKTNTTINGVKFDVLEDGWVRVHGTATDTAVFNYVGTWNGASGVHLPKNFIVGATQNKQVGVYFFGYDESGNRVYMKAGKTSQDYKDLYIYLEVVKGTTVDAIVKPYAGAKDGLTDYAIQQLFTFQTPDGLKGIPLGQVIPNAIANSPVHMGGVYHDGDQYWIGDTKNEDGKNVQRIGVIDSYSSEAITITPYLSTTGELSRGAEVHYILPEPIVTDVTEEELNQCKAVVTNYPTTTIYNDADAFVVVEYVADTKNYIDSKTYGDTPSQESVLLTDISTGTKYRLYVTNGELRIGEMEV